MSRQERKPISSEPLFDCIVCMLMPIMNDQPVQLGPVKPPALDQSYNQFVCVALVIDRKGDIGIRKLAYIALRGFSCGEVPQILEQPRGLVMA
jgi:hypothetical protein